MTGRRWRACLAVAAGVAMTLAAPALAMSHGFAHAELREHAAHHGDSGRLLPAAHEPGHHGDHGHPTLDCGVTARVIQLLPAALPAPATFVLLAAAGRDTRTPPAPNASPPPGVDRSPTRSRAPPAALTT